MQIVAHDPMNAKARARWGDGRIEVTAKWDRISIALAQSWPLTRIYEAHIDPDVISYSQFRRQVQRRLKIDSDRPSGPKVTASVEPSPQPKDAEPINARRKSASSSRAYYEPPKHDDATKDRLVGPRRKS